MDEVQKHTNPECYTPSSEPPDSTQRQNYLQNINTPLPDYTVSPPQGHDKNLPSPHKPQLYENVNMEHF